MSRKTFDELVAEFQESQREKSPLEQTVSAQWEQFKVLKNTNEAAAQQYIDSLFKSEYGFLPEDESISLDNVKESTFFDANLHNETQKREQERLKREGESLLQEYCNDNNRDVTSSCAICDLSILQCLCAFEMSLIDKEEIKYEWKVAKNTPILSSFLVLANENQKASLKYSIIGTCIHGKTDCCKLLYAQMNPERKATEKRDSKTGVLDLEFNLDPFTSDSGESATPYYVHYSQNKGILHQADETSSLILGANQIPEFTASGFIASFKRAFSLACTSKITNMPAVLYDIIVQECDGERYLPRNYVRTYLLPQYEVEFGLTLDFNGGVSFDKGVDFETSKGQSYSQLGLNIEGHLTEKIFSDKTLEYKAEVAVPQMASAAKEHLSTADGFVATFLKMLTLLEKVKVPMKSFSALPVTMGFIFPKIIIEGSYKLKYADPPKEDDKTASKGSSLNQAQNIIQVKRENTKIEANPLLGGALKLDILEMLASVLGPGAGKVIRQAMNYQGKSVYFKAKADLIAALTGGGYLEIDSSLANELPKYNLKNLRANLSVKLQAQIEAGIRSFVFSAAFTAGFTVKAKFELGFYTNSENEELGWYFGTNGAALYWTLIFSFGIGGDRGKDNENKDTDKAGYGSASLDATDLANRQTESWDESLAKQSDVELKRTQKYLQDLKEKKVFDRPMDFNYRDGDENISLGNILKRQNQMNKLIIGKDKLTPYIDELAMLTKKYNNQQGYLSSEDNSRRLALKVEVEKIYQKYGVATDIRGNLNSQQEYNLLEQRKKELDQIIKDNSLNVEVRRQEEDMLMGRTHKNPVAADVRKRRLEAEKELSNITDDQYQSTGKAVLIEASIFAFDNLVSKDLETIKKEMYSRLEG